MPVRIGAPAEASFADPVRLLSDCHRRVEMFLGVLVKCAEAAVPGSPPRAELANALRYFRESGPRHTADEEESLFPRLTGNAQARETMRALEADHERAEPLHALVDRVGERWIGEQSLSAADIGEFSSAVHQLAEMYRRHIEIEDTHLFPLAERVLSAEEKREVGREMAKRRNTGG